ncbi:brix domain-containing protein [Ordospora pajunii]|uniref:brix domain-containing protein n=1 Tax=Ordospora pajunii TaxID=3039483 RepID=UPI00295266E5|nr:brix domain-containing protein [Ordospora pajunii]KAH9410937.1 brix domain-containing protein [Ordospora pajunii]
MSFSNKLVITAKKPTKRTKQICEHLRRMLEPNVTAKLKDKNTTVKSYIDIADAFELSHFILVDARDIKVGIRPNGPTYIFNVVEYNPKYVRVDHEHYRDDPLITFSGSSPLKSLFSSLSSQPSTSRRNIHFHFDDDLIHIRHYAILTKDEDDIKVGFTEIGPRITVRHIKKLNGFFR